MTAERGAAKPADRAHSPAKDGTESASATLNRAKCDKVAIVKSEDEQVEAAPASAPDNRLGSKWSGQTRSLGPLLGVLIAACAPDASRTPLSSPVVPHHDVYFYGPSGVSKQPRARAQRRRPPRQPAKEIQAQGADAGSTEADAEGEHTASSATERDQEQAAESRSGTYRGSDRVIINFDGLPEQAQDDDAAKVRVELQDADKQRYAVSVLDSNTDNPLCTVEGELEDQRIEFTPDQTCFAGILGAPMKAKLLSGEASFEGEKLQVELEVSLELSAPGATLDGSLLYSFEGRR